MSHTTATHSDVTFTVGIEEEYLLVSRETRDLVADPPPELLAECERRLTGRASPEFLRSQIEVGTRIHRSMSELRADLSNLRATVAEVAASYGLAPIAASTHPFARWYHQRHTDKDRYTILAQDLQGVVRRLLICGMHVHVGIEDNQLRIDLMNQIAYFLPHLLALSTSSPFWGGEDLGLKSYRLSVFNELPRTGLPEVFESYEEYERHVRVLVQAGLIEDSTKIWWDVRPSARYPTLEMRIADVCTRLDDALTVAALYRCLLRMLYRLRRHNQRWRLYAHMLINENRWRAQRYGFDSGLVDFGKGCVVPYAELLKELLELVKEDAEYLGCQTEVGHAWEILRRGSSAHRQVRTYTEALAAGADSEEALRAVVDRLIRETVQDCAIHSEFAASQAQ
ncbi:MAG: carboxylate-amine ligase [Gammaproteobacteria bacterium]|nr:carboxylate-amine ligase [Gammaproteobacteria bacterium]MCP5459282.1 carboxylate-amine ligase [Gammaproteobacteria bacterium]